MPFYTDDEEDDTCAFASASVFTVTEEDLEFDTDDEDPSDYEENLEHMRVYFEKNAKNIGIQDGDIIESQCLCSGYRNHGKFLWWNGEVMELYTDVDDYGGLPPCIQISDTNSFNPYYWIDVIDHNTYVWFSSEIRERLKFTRNVFDDGGVAFSATTTIKGHEWNFEFRQLKETTTLEQFQEKIKGDECTFSTCAKDFIIYVGLQ
jgi:hypothetical protein